MRKKIAKALRTIGNSKCLEKAKQLEDDGFQTSTLHLRDLSLTPNDSTAIVTVLKQEHYNDAITSISFSYNKEIGDAGASVLAKSLPTSLSENGLVDCGIGDEGGREILNSIKTLKQLKMICIEQNKFSDHLKIEYKIFGQAHPKILIVF